MEGNSDRDSVQVEVTDATPTSNGDWTPVEQDFNGAIMVKVPAGSFMMGDNGADGEQTFERAFWIDKTEVTQVAYNECVNADPSGCTPPSGGFSFPNANNPAERVNAHQAAAYCQWRGARLPTEEEWEYTARGPSNLIYPWGNNVPNTGTDPFPSNLLNYALQHGFTTTPVGDFPLGESWVGARDMSGNVWEWTSTVHETGASFRVRRGGSLVSDSNSVRAALRIADHDLNANLGIGFRCARS